MYYSKLYNLNRWLHNLCMIHVNFVSMQLCAAEVKMAYSNDMTKINLALSADDLDRFKGVKAFTNIATDAEAVRYCIRATYLALCQDDCKLVCIDNVLECISNLRIELLALIRE